MNGRPNTKNEPNPEPLNEKLCTLPNELPRPSVSDERQKRENNIFIKVEYGGVYDYRIKCST